MANFDPTAANIIASLGVKGATTGATTGNQYQGYVPVLNADGMLSASLIPANAAQISIPALSNAAFVDPYTTVAAELRKGSIVAPYASLAEAADRFDPTEDAKAAGHAAFVLAPGKYGDDAMVFTGDRMPLGVYLIGLGECAFASNVTSFSISGFATAAGRRPSVWIQGVTMNGSIVIAANADVTIAGKSYVHELSCETGGTLRLASESRVDSTNAATVTYLSDDARIGNTSTVAGTTVRDALTRLGARKVRIANVSTNSSGFDVDSSSSYIDVQAGSSSGFDVFDLRERDRIFVDGINELFRRSKGVVADAVTADTITAGVANITTLNMNGLMLGGYRLSVDAYGYLVVSDGSATPPQPPSNVILLSDADTGAIYMVGVASGRIYIAPADADSTSPGSQEHVTVYDSQTGDEYSLSVQSGRMVITRTGGQS